MGGIVEERNSEGNGSSMNNYVSLKQLSSELSMDRSHLRKYVIGMGIQPEKRRTPDSGNQLTLTLSGKQAETVRKSREDAGFETESPVAGADVGVFYLVQLVPELDESRIKMGYANSIDARMAQHRTAAPTAVVVAEWPCKRAWERTAMDCLSASCRLIYSEVFECDNLEALEQFGDSFFAMLPDPLADVELSEHSPLNS